MFVKFILKKCINLFIFKKCLRSADDHRSPLHQNCKAILYYSLLTIHFSLGRYKTCPYTFAIISYVLIHKKGQVQLALKSQLRPDPFGYSNSLKYSFILIINSCFTSSIVIPSTCAPAKVMCPPPPKFFKY